MPNTQGFAANHAVQLVRYSIGKKRLEREACNFVNRKTWPTYKVIHRKKPSVALSMANITVKVGETMLGDGYLVNYTCVLYFAVAPINVYLMLLVCNALLDHYNKIVKQASYGDEDHSNQSYM